MNCWIGNGSADWIVIGTGTGGSALRWVGCQICIGLALAGRHGIVPG